MKLLLRCYKYVIPQLFQIMSLKVFHYEKFTVGGGSCLLFYFLPTFSFRKKGCFCKHLRRYDSINIPLKFIHNGKLITNMNKVYHNTITLFR